MNLKIIIGSTRPGRAADQVVSWIVPAAREHGGFHVEVADLRDWDLPIFSETLATVADFRDPAFSTPVVNRWNSMIAEGDAFLFVTPEYNHSVPAVLIPGRPRLQRQGRLRLEGIDYEASAPALVSSEEADPHVRVAFSRLERSSMRIFGIRQFLRLSVVPGPGWHRSRPRSPASSRRRSA